MRSGRSRRCSPASLTSLRSVGQRISQTRPLPRSKEGWIDALQDAADVGERIGAPQDVRGGRRLRVWLLFAVVGATSFLGTILAAPAIFLTQRSVGAIAERFSQPIEQVALPDVAQRSIVFDRNGKVIATLTGVENRKVVALSNIGQIAQDAVISVEDSNFYLHRGVDLAGLVRALLSNLRAGGISQGGSTITQQLVKNTLVGNERSLDRKITEARMAVRLEEDMSKEEILETYLNETYFANGVYGIGTAAEYYFGKPASKLNLSQAAMLAGMIRAPENYEPFDNPDEAKRRRAYALGRMLDEGKITRKQHDRALGEPLGAKPHPVAPSKTPYFVEAVKAQIMSDPAFGATREDRAAALFSAGLRIETTIDLEMQDDAQRAVETVLNQSGDPDAALVSIEANTGAVLAMVGGRNFEEEKFNLATQGRRQPGSTFKPFTMVAALENGFAPALTFDTPSPLVTTDGTGATYTVNNYSGNGEGFMSMRQATAFSVNTYYIQLIEHVGPDKVSELATRLGIETELGPYASLALGSVAVSPFELASAYATLANEGTRCAPFSITRVIDARGKALLRTEPDCEEVLDPNVALMASDILRGVPEFGTGRTNGQIGRPVTGKTGTTDDYTDSWYAGYTPQIATAVWLGFAESTERQLKNIHGLPKVFGGSLPATIWSKFMRAAHEGLPVLDFGNPSAIGSVAVPTVIGLPLREARSKLEEAGFFTVETKMVASSEPLGTVLAQDPVGTAARGVLVRLSVSNGAAPKPSPTPSPTPSPATSTKKPKPSPKLSPSPTPSPKPDPEPTAS